MESSATRFAAGLLEEKVAARLREAGASEASLAAATRAMLHASLVGVDSHGVRLTEHYCNMLDGGRLNKAPQLKVDIRAASSAMVHGDDGMGHYAAYKAVEVGIELAQKAGVGAVGIDHSSHLGAAGAYALAGVATLFSALLTGTTLDADFIPMYGGPGGDISTPRNMGHFVLVIDPDKFVGRAMFGAMITRYLASLRAAPVRPGAERVMAPGDREWDEMARRQQDGVPVDPDTVRFLGL